MAQQGVRFVRIHGRIVPIRQKGDGTKHAVNARTTGQLAHKFRKAASSAKYGAYADTLTGVLSGTLAVSAAEVAHMTRSPIKAAASGALVIGAGMLALRSVMSAASHAQRSIKMGNLAKRFSRAGKKNG